MISQTIVTAYSATYKSGMVYAYPARSIRCRYLDDATIPQIEQSIREELASIEGTAIAVVHVNGRKPNGFLAWYRSPATLLLRHKSV